MIALLLACRPTPVPTPVPPVPSPVPTPTGDTGAPSGPVDLRSPEEAQDLDPSPDVLHVSLTAASHSWEVDGVVVDGFAYNGQVPGPTLRARVGDTLVVDLTNDLGETTTIHWHGPTVPYAMDGAGWQVSPVPAGGTFTYTFTLQEPGTFWYHPHFDTDQQVDLGLYGVLVVEDPDDPPVDEELVVVFDSVGEVGASASNPGIDPSPTWWSVNGLREPVWRPQAGRTVRVRTVNVSNAGYLGLRGRVIATDQGLLQAASDQVVIVPGDRADLEVSVGPQMPAWTGERYSHAGLVPGPDLPLFTVEPSGAEAAPGPTDWGFSGIAPSVDPGRTDLRYVFTGSPSAGWEINGATWPVIVPDEVSLGSEVILEIRNLSSSHHPFHLHGMAFEVLSVDGVPPDVKTVEDTWDVAVQSVVRLRIEADNLGDWMSHCHILPHADSGMMTVLSVVP
jgi:FtsP/CotA-like multicopper oxidase with cupredoxin domain